MPFIMEKLTDDMRREAGFALTMDEKVINMPCKYVRNWAIDRERDVYCTLLRSRRDYAYFEMNWQSYVLQIIVNYTSDYYPPREEWGGVGKYDYHYIIKSIQADKGLQKSAEQISAIATEAIAFYWSRDIQIKGKLTAEISPNATIDQRFQVRSQCKPDPK